MRELNVDLRKTDFVSTHRHPDHRGLIPKFATENSTTYMGKIDVDGITHEETRGWGPILKNAKDAGFPLEPLKKLFFNISKGYIATIKHIEWTPLYEGDEISIGDYKLICIETPGHTWGHICLYEPNKKILFTGDHILGDITPVIIPWSKNDNPLGQYIESLNKVAKMDVAYTLPGHRNLIVDCDKRIREIKKHHLERCNELLDILQDGSRSAFQITSQMTWDIHAKSWEESPLMQKYHATAETVAHLRFLEDKELLTKDLSDDKVFQYSLSGRGGKISILD